MVTWTIDDVATLPALSVEVVWNVCAPSDNALVVNVQLDAVPFVACNAPPSTDICVLTKLVSDEVPDKATVDEPVIELSAGEVIAVVGFVVSMVTWTIDDVATLPA